MTQVILSNNVSVNPAFVASTEISDTKNRVLLTMHDGRTYSLPCEYGKSIFKTRDDMVKKLNEALG